MQQRGLPPDSVRRTLGPDGSAAARGRSRRRGASPAPRISPGAVRAAPGQGRGPSTATPLGTGPHDVGHVWESRGGGQGESGGLAGRKAKSPGAWTGFSPVAAVSALPAGSSRFRSAPGFLPAASRRVRVPRGGQGLGDPLAASALRALPPGPATARGAGLLRVPRPRARQEARGRSDGEARGCRVAPPAGCPRGAQACRPAAAEDPPAQTRRVSGEGDAWHRTRSRTPRPFSGQVFKRPCSDQVFLDVAPACWPGRVL